MNPTPEELEVARLKKSVKLELVRNAENLHNALALRLEELQIRRELITQTLKENEDEKAWIEAQMRTLSGIRTLISQTHNLA